MTVNYQQGIVVVDRAFHEDTTLQNAYFDYRFTKVTPQNKQEYVRLALNYRLHEFDEQVKAVRDGMSKVIPVPLLSLFSATQLQVTSEKNLFFDQNTKHYIEFHFN